MSELSVRDLEAKLEAAKKAEKLAAEDKEMAQIIDAYVGKAYGTSTFAQNKKNKWERAIHIQKIERTDENLKSFGYSPGLVICHYTSIDFLKGPDNYNHSGYQVRYSRGSYTECLNSGDYNMFSRIYNLIYRMKEIPVPLFESLYAAGDEIEPILIDTFSSKLALTIEKTCGDGTNQYKLLEAYKACGIELIDLEKYPKLLHAIRYERLPGYFEDRFLIKVFAKQALELKIAENRTDMASPWCEGRRYMALDHEIKTIEEHIKLLKL